MESTSTTENNQFSEYNNEYLMETENTMETDTTSKHTEIENCENTMNDENSKFTNQELIEFFQTQFCLALSDREWDLFTVDQYGELYKKIAFALCGPPKQITDDGTDIVYEPKQHTKVKPVYDTIIKYGSYDRIQGNIYMSTIFVFCEELSKKNNGAIFQVPVFRIRKCHPKIDEYDHYQEMQSSSCYGFSISANVKSAEYCQLFIDDEARVYQSWKHYLKNNKLPKCRIFVPRNGKYQVRVLGDDYKQVEAMLDIHMSPACSMIQRITNTADVVGTVGGIGSATLCVMAAIPAITIAPVVLTGAAVIGVGTGLYAGGRGILGLVDRKSHKQTVSLKDAESRGHWLNAAGGIVAGGAAGATKMISTAIEKGATIGMAGRAAFNIVGGANLIVNGAGVLNSLYLFKTKYENKEKISTLEILQFSTSLLFFTHAVWTTKSAKAFINETQDKVLANYEEMLCSNRKKRMFNKALKESQRTKGVTEGKAEMIRGLSKIQNRDDFFGVLVRNNKLFNEEGATFTVGANGQIQINNNVFIDASEFSSMSVSTKRNFFATLPEQPIPRTNATKVNTSSVVTQVYPGNTSKFKLTPADVLKIGNTLAQLLGNSSLKKTIDSIFEKFDFTVQTVLEDILLYFCNEVQDLNGKIANLFPNTAAPLAVLQFMFQYLDKYLKTYEPNRSAYTGSSNFDICNINSSMMVLCDPEKIRQFTAIILNADRVFIQEIVRSFRVWIEVKIKAYWESYQQMKRSMSLSVEHQCSICNGVYYSSN